MTITEALTRAVLQWYANPRSWAPALTRGPYSSGTAAAAVSDAGAVARKVLEAKSDGQLFAAACDAWGLSVTEVGRRAGMDDVEISRFASGLSTLRSPHAEAVLGELQRSIAERLGR